MPAEDFSPKTSQSDDLQQFIETQLELLLLKMIFNMLWWLWVSPSLSLLISRRDDDTQYNQYINQSPEDRSRANLQNINTTKISQTMDNIQHSTSILE
jgi:hypothetical protein